MEKIKKTTEILKELGVPANVKGYEVLRSAICMVIDDFQLVYHITTKLYPALAKQFESTPSRMERAIRYAIETGWYRGNYETQQKLFSYSYDAKKGKPTNGEFIAAIADYIRL